MQLSTENLQPRGANSKACLEVQDDAAGTGCHREDRFFEPGLDLGAVLRLLGTWAGGILGVKLSML